MGLAVRDLRPAKACALSQARTLRVLQVTESPGGGVLTVVASLAARLADEGHAVCVACGRRPETPLDLLAMLPSGVHVVSVPWAGRTVRAQLQATRALRRLVRTWEPDLVHLHSSFAGMVGALVLPRGMPSVYTPHSYAFSWSGLGPARRMAFLAGERLIARRCTVIGAVSEDEADLARRLAHARRVVLVRNGIPELDPDRLPVPANRPQPVVIALGRISAQRQPEAATRILGALADTAAVCWVGGAPADEDVAVRTAGIPTTGWLSRQEALELLASATVLIHWSASDGQSLAILEAMARDVVVVASDIPPNRELLGADQVCATEAEAIALARRALLDPIERERMLASQRIRRSVHSESRMTSEWMALYEQLVDEQAGGPKLDTA